jgi:hypothetical protein
MSRRPKPLASCYIYPENGKKFAHIAVMGTLKDLRHLAKFLRVPSYSKLTGFCSPIRGDRFALVGLCKRGLSPRIVAHEMTHMALMYLSEVDDLPKDPCRSANERLCDLVGNSTASFYAWARDKGLY